MINVKLNIRHKEFWGAVVAMASVALCAVIDVFLKETAKEDPEEKPEKDLN